MIENDFKFNCGDEVMTVGGERGKIAAQKFIYGKKRYDVVVRGNVCLSDVNELDLSKL